MYSDATTINYQEQYILNNNGMVHYIVEITDHPGDVEYDTAFYTYNPLGNNSRIVYKSQYVGTNNSISYDTIWNTYTDGNLTSTTFKNSNGETKTTNYTYTNLVDKANILGGELPFMPNLYGVPSKNMPLHGTNATGSYTEDYTYIMNADGYISKRRVEYVNTAPANTYISDLRFYYTCQ
jgi:hypothetical protein